MAQTLFVWRRCFVRLQWPATVLPSMNSQKTETSIGSSSGDVLSLSSRTPKVIFWQLFSSVPAAFVGRKDTRSLVMWSWRPLPGGEAWERPSSNIALMQRRGCSTGRFWATSLALTSRSWGWYRGKGSSSQPRSRTWPSSETPASSIPTWSGGLLCSHGKSPPVQSCRIHTQGGRNGGGGRRRPPQPPSASWSRGGAVSPCLPHPRPSPRLWYGHTPCSSKNR